MTAKQTKETESQSTAKTLKPRLDALNLGHKRESSSNATLSSFQTNGTMSWRAGEISSSELPIRLYRFMKESIPVISSCIWTWSRLVSAPASYQLPSEMDNKSREAAQSVLDRMSQRLLPFGFRRTGGLSAFLPMMFDTLFTDGAFAGFVELSSDRSRIAQFTTVDVTGIRSVSKRNGQAGLVLETEKEAISLDRPDFHYFALNTDPTTELGVRF